MYLVVAHTPKKGTYCKVLITSTSRIYPRLLPQTNQTNPVRLSSARSSFRSFRTGFSLTGILQPWSRPLGPLKLWVGREAEQGDKRG